MNLKIAIPVNDNRLHGHFGGSTHFALVEANPETKEIVSTQILEAPEHVPGAFPRWLQQQGVQVVIVGGIGHRALAIFAHHNIAVRTGTPNAPVEELVRAYLNDELAEAPDGCEHHEHHHDHHHEHGHGHGRGPGHGRGGGRGPGHRHGAGHGYGDGFGRGHGRGQGHAHDHQHEEKPSSESSNS